MEQVALSRTAYEVRLEEQLREHLQPLDNRTMDEVFLYVSELVHSIETPDELIELFRMDVDEETLRKFREALRQEPSAANGSDLCWCAWGGIRGTICDDWNLCEKYKACSKGVDVASSFLGFWGALGGSLKGWLPPVMVTHPHIVLPAAVLVFCGWKLGPDWMCKCNKERDRKKEKEEEKKEQQP